MLACLVNLVVSDSKFFIFIVVTLLKIFLDSLLFLLVFFGSLLENEAVVVFLGQVSQRLLKEFAEF